MHHDACFDWNSDMNAYTEEVNRLLVRDGSCMHMFNPKRMQWYTVQLGITAEEVSPQKGGSVAPAFSKLPAHICLLLTSSGIIRTVHGAPADDQPPGGAEKPHVTACEPLCAPLAGGVGIPGGFGSVWAAVPAIVEEVCPNSLPPPAPLTEDKRKGRITPKYCLPRRESTCGTVTRMPRETDFTHPRVRQASHSAIRRPQFRAEARTHFGDGSKLQKEKRWPLFFQPVCRCVPRWGPGGIRTPGGTEQGRVEAVWTALHPGWPQISFGIDLRHRFGAICLRCRGTLCRREKQLDTHNCPQCGQLRGFEKAFFCL